MDFVEYVRRVGEPMCPIPTALSPKLVSGFAIEAVVFDIYGTLIQSAAGDIGPHGSRRRRDGMRQAAEILGAEAGNPGEWLEAYRNRIREQREERSRSGSAVPEIEIRDVWRSLDRELGSGDAGSDAIEEAALCYECASNPTAPMPGALDAIERVRRSGRSLGILSNAQFYTPAVVAANLERPWESIGFDPELSVFSWREREAKPSPRLYSILVDGLRDLGLDPGRTLYIGNDVRKDVRPAREIGLITALFAGDGRSLRFDAGGKAEAFSLSDFVLTDWEQLAEILT